MQKTRKNRRSRFSDRKSRSCGGEYDSNQQFGFEIDASAGSKFGFRLLLGFNPEPAPKNWHSTLSSRLNSISVLLIDAPKFQER